MIQRIRFVWPVCGFAAAVEELTKDARTREVGRMLSGERVTPEALRHAEQLIKLGVE